MRPQLHPAQAVEGEGEGYGEGATTNCPPAERLLLLLLHSGRHAQRVAIDVDTTSRAASCEAPHAGSAGSVTWPRRRCMADDDDDSIPAQLGSTLLTLSAPAYHQWKSSCQSIYSYAIQYACVSEGERERETVTHSPHAQCQSSHISMSGSRLPCICCNENISNWYPYPFFLSLVSGPLSEVLTAVGSEVALPCDLMPGTMIADKVQLVIWYRQGNVKPIYT